MKTERVTLRKFRSDDLDNVFRGLSHPEVIRYYGVSFQTREDTLEQMEFFENLENEGTGIWWAVCSADGKVFYGAGGINNINREHRKAEVGFWLIPEFWGKGIMQEAMTLICRYAFEELGMHRLEGFVETENLNCKKAIEKAGFMYEGTMADFEIKNNRYISIDIYALINSSERSD